MVTIRWWGHACFEIRTSDGFTLVVDPHDGGSIGLPRPQVKADAVLITHEHFDHNAYQVVLKEGCKVFSMKKGRFQVNGFTVTGFEAYHDEFKGRRRGKVVIYSIEAEGLRMLHTGDLGHLLDNKTVQNLGNIDILMVPVGGTFTIDSRGALELSSMINPKAVVPMHYWVKGINLPLRPLDDFLRIASSKYDILRLQGNEWSISKDELLSWPKTKVIVFPFKV